MSACCDKVVPCKTERLPNPHELCTINDDFCTVDFPHLQDAGARSQTSRSGSHYGMSTEANRTPGSAVTQGPSATWKSLGFEIAPDKPSKPDKPDKADKPLKPDKHEEGHGTCTTRRGCDGAQFGDCLNVKPETSEKLTSEPHKIPAEIHGIHSEIPTEIHKVGEDDILSVATTEYQSRTSSIRQMERVQEEQKSQNAPVVLQGCRARESIPSSSSEMNQFRHSYRAEINAKIEENLGKSEEKKDGAPGGSKPDFSKISVCKKRYSDIAGKLISLAKSTPLKMIPPVKALHFCATYLGHGQLEQDDFVDLLGTLVREMGLAREITEHDIIAAFYVIDCDHKGKLTVAHWITGVPLFLGATRNFQSKKGKSQSTPEADDVTLHTWAHDVATEVFQQLDKDCSGELDIQEFAKFVTPVVFMIVPPDDVQLREQLQEQLARHLFNLFDVDHSGLVNPEEFSKWSESQSVASEAFHVLEEILKTKVEGG